MNVPLLDLQAQYATIKDRVRAAVDGILDSQRFVLGAQVSALEEEIAKLCGVPFAIGVASGTDALLLSLKALGVGPGDSVVTVPFTFFATAGTVVNLGARPIFVDIEPAGFEMDPERLLSFLAQECAYEPTGKKTVHKASGTTVKAIVPVHLYGQCVDMDEILEIARRYNLPVVEDACQAIGATYKGRKAGAMGNLGCFSFFPSKNLGGAGDGGMVVTSDSRLADQVRLLRMHGAHPKYFHAIVGFNSRLDELQAAILRVKLPYLQTWSEARGQNALKYGKDIAAADLLSYVTPPAALPDRTHIYHQYVIRCRKRDELLQFLKAAGIGTEIYYPVSLHEQECFHYLGYAAADLPQSHAASLETLALPVYPELSDEQRKYVVNSIAEFYGK
ncbi:MAG TPA: DegT/DnrJ/EryC1/StrS family aminotransferase [Acidobacteriota bacterium]|nr:DegT/DnrJ/EryC1/StrS family aminotransferase [Acidobacteriota bacterium]